MLNIGIENIQPKVSTETEMPIEELIDFATAVGMYSDEIDQDFKVLDQHILAVENLISVLDNLREHGVTPAIEALVGNQIELSEASFENFITEGIKKVVDFIKGIIKKIKEFFTGKKDETVKKQIDECEQILNSNDENDKQKVDEIIERSIEINVCHVLIEPGADASKPFTTFCNSFKQWGAEVNSNSMSSSAGEGPLATMQGLVKGIPFTFGRRKTIFESRENIKHCLSKANSFLSDLKRHVREFERLIPMLEKNLIEIGDKNDHVTTSAQGLRDLPTVARLFKDCLHQLNMAIFSLQNSINNIHRAMKSNGYRALDK